MNKALTPEQLEKARMAKTPEALLALAAEQGAVLTPEEAQAHFDQIHQTGAVADEELENVSGGCGGGPSYDQDGYLYTTADSTCSYFRCNRCYYDYNGERVTGHLCFITPHGATMVAKEMQNVCGECRHFGNGSTGTGTCRYSYNRKS